MVESPLGRRGSLAAMTALTAMSCFMFVQVRGPLLIRLSSLGISMSSTVSIHFLRSCTVLISLTRTDDVCRTVRVSASTESPHKRETNEFGEGGRPRSLGPKSAERPVEWQAPFRGCTYCFISRLHAAYRPPRSGGMIGPLLGGALLVIDPAYLVYCSIVVYIFATAFVLLLRETGINRGERSIAH